MGKWGAALAGLGLGAFAADRIVEPPSEDELKPAGHHMVLSEVPKPQEEIEHGLDAGAKKNLDEMFDGSGHFSNQGEKKPRKQKGGRNDNTVQSDTTEEDTISVEVLNRQRQEKIAHMLEELTNQLQEIPGITVARYIDTGGNPNDDGTRIVVSGKNSVPIMDIDINPEMNIYTVVAINPTSEKFGKRLSPDQDTYFALGDVDVNNAKQFIENADHRIEQYKKKVSEWEEKTFATPEERDAAWNLLVADYAEEVGSDDVKKGE